MSYTKSPFPVWDGIEPLSVFIDKICGVLVELKHAEAYSLMTRKIENEDDYNVENDKKRLMINSLTAIEILKKCFKNHHNILILIQKAQEDPKSVGRIFSETYDQAILDKANTVYKLVEEISTGPDKSHYSLISKALADVASLRFHGSYRDFKAKVLHYYGILAQRRKRLGIEEHAHTASFHELLNSFPPVILTEFTKAWRDEKPGSVLTLSDLFDRADAIGDSYDASTAIASANDMSSTDSYAASSTSVRAASRRYKEKNPNRSTQKKEKKHCDIHGWCGHSSADCRARKQKMKQQPRGSITSSSLNVACAGVATSTTDSIIGIDSHTTNTVVPYAGLLHEYEPFDSPVKVTAYDGTTSHQCLGKGILVMDVQFPSMKPLRVRIRDAVYIPGATHILIQSEKLCNSKTFPVGFTNAPYTRIFYGDHNGPEIRCAKDRKAYIPNDRVKLVYPDGSVIPAGQQLSISSTSTSTSLAKLNTPRNMSMEVLHKRLGHRSEAAVKAEARLRNLKLTTDTIGFCEVCVEAKSTKKPVNTTRSKLRQRALQSVQQSNSPSFFEYESHKDPIVTEVPMVSATTVGTDNPEVESVLLKRQRVIVSDLFSVKFKGRPYYVALFKDVETRYVFAYGMKNKHRLPHALRALRASGEIKILAGDIL